MKCIVCVHNGLKNKDASTAAPVQAAVDDATTAVAVINGQSLCVNHIHERMEYLKDVVPKTAEEDLGDILQPLKRVRDKYNMKADELREKAPGSGASDPEDKLRRKLIPDAADSYNRMAAAVERLITVIENAGA